MQIQSGVAQQVFVVIGKAHCSILDATLTSAACVAAFAGRSVCVLGTLTSILGRHAPG